MTFQAGNVSTVAAQEAAIQGTLEHAIRYPARDKNARPTTEFSTRVPDFADTRALDALLRRKGVVVTAKAPPGTPWWETLLAGFGPAILFFGLWYLVMRRSGSDSMFSFARTKAKKYEPTAERVSFADVAPESTRRRTSSPRSSTSSATRTSTASSAPTSRGARC